MRLLLAEDERDLNRLITRKLTSAGYSVDSFFDGEEAIHVLSYTDYDGVILDIMMPKADGFAVLRSLRERGKTTPVLFLTARDAIADRVRGLDSGANDYLVKPFAFEELLARIRAMTRLSFGASESVLTVGDLTLNLATQEVRRGGQPITLSAKEYALLEYLMHNQGIVLSREKIENHIWNLDYEGGTNVVDVYISYLRKKIDEGRKEKLIHTVRGRGYVLREDKAP
ncbi:MAG TPA: response regulator transcription factor [Candidatus Avoscillospira stercoripullorum]|uniref:Stage 0 sporulation protein A homolog n=1 Tax=Candidatus Avoscillospira stercoripullorum TaxID=2840709 RepID=A0A9D1A6A8_9FIRM|nr:response regulator transcription factor [Candidatus Avoscillospira stercoripullorum]